MKMTATQLSHLTISEQTAVKALKKLHKEGKSTGKDRRQDGRRFERSGCKKVFVSKQALDGHMSSNVKCLANIEEGGESSNRGVLVAVETKEKESRRERELIKCNVCSKFFHPKGIGKHKTSHNMTQERFKKHKITIHAESGGGTRSVEGN